MRLIPTVTVQLVGPTTSLPLNGQSATLLDLGESLTDQRLMVSSWQYQNTKYPYITLGGGYWIAGKIIKGYRIILDGSIVARKEQIEE